jgi:hypothetical protein
VQQGALRMESFYYLMNLKVWQTIVWGMSMVGFIGFAAMIYMLQSTIAGYWHRRYWAWKRNDFDWPVIIVALIVPAGTILVLLLTKW